MPTTTSRLITPTTKFHLHSAPLSGCTARVRIAAHLKKIPNITYHNLDFSSSQHKSSKYRHINPNGSVPALVIENPGGESVIITQSSAILDLLETYYPTPPLLPSATEKPVDRARVLELVNLVACDIQPPQASRVRAKLEEDFGGDGVVWARWVYERGFDVYEEFLRKGMGGGGRGRFSVGDEVGLADVYLVPAVQGAWRVGVRVGDESGRKRWPLLRGVVERCWGLEAFRKGGLDGEKWVWDF